MVNLDRSINWFGHPSTGSFPANIPHNSNSKFVHVRDGQFGSMAAVQYSSGPNASGFPCAWILAWNAPADDTAPLPPNQVYVACGTKERMDLISWDQILLKWRKLQPNPRPTTRTRRQVSMPKSTIQMCLICGSNFEPFYLPCSWASSYETQSAVSAANLLIQSAESALPKQKRVLAASEFKQAKIAYKRRGKILQDDKGSLNLPQDILVHLFCYLDVQSLLTAGLVCRSWNAAANDSYLWQFQYTNHFDDSESVSKFKGLADNDTAVGKQHELSTEVCTNVNQNWKDNFRKAYLGNPYKSDRGYCLCCKSIVWLNNLRCPNQGLGRRANKHELDPLSPDQIGKYIAEELELPLLTDSEEDNYCICRY
ncbi:hypothetical protein KSS87_010737 [Heliosperma pusillum]|nr:hypothetical protein KSS87_010737 [Heliosperma pusillum]